MGEERMQEGSGRRNLLSYLDGFPLRRDRPLYLWRDGVRWRGRSYGEVHDRSLACAGMLAGAGIGPGDAVLIQGPEAADWAEALHAVLRVGGVAVPLSPETPDDFRCRVARKVEATVLIAPAMVTPPPHVERIEMGSWPERPLQEPPRADPGPEDRAEIVFTSGTTGEPKGVVLTHGNLVSDLAPIEDGFRRWRPYVRLAAGRPLLSTVPLSHMFGQVIAAFLLPFMGLSIAMTPPRPREVIEAAARHRAWGMITVPRVLDLLASELRRLVEREWDPEVFRRRRERFAGRSFLLQSLAFHRIQRRLGWRFRFLLSGGAALPRELLRFYEDIGYLVAQGYGLTETAPVVAVSNPFRRGSPAVGKPLRGQEVKLGPEGEVWVRGGNVSPGYLGEGELTAQDGWFRTGDLGEIDADGNLSIKGRVKDVIVTAEGENVHAADVERVLEAIDGVRQACVVGLPASGGDQVHAVLVLAAAADGRQVMRSANEKLERRQRIRDFTVWPDEDLPRTATGKVRKGEVVDAVLAKRAGLSDRDALGAARGSLRALIARVAGVQQNRIEDGTRLADDLGLQSLDLVELVATVEEEMGVMLPEEGIEAATFGDLRKLVSEAGARAAGGGDGGGRREPDRAGAPGQGERADRAERREAAGHEARSESERHGAAVRPARRSESGWRGRLSMPRWAASPPVHLLRRLIEEAVIVPFVRLHARTTVVGRENLQGLEAPFLILANHRSYLDTALVKLCLPARLRGRVAPAMTTRYHRCAFGEVSGSVWRYASERFQVLLLQLLFHAWPLPETVGFPRSLSYAGELADRRFIPLAFPEGRHVPEGEMQSFRGGTGMLARDLRCPVLPVYLEGTATVLPAGALWLHRGRARVVFGRPFRIDPESSAEEAMRRTEEAVRSISPFGPAGR